MTMSPLVGIADPRDKKSLLYKKGSDANFDTGYMCVI